MKNIWTKLLAMTLCVLMIVAPMSGLAEEVVISSMISSSAGILPPEENFVIDGIEAAVGFQVDIMVSANSDDYKQRKAALTAARNLPDIISLDRVELAEMVENGAVIPLNDLLEQYGQNVLADKGEYLGGYTFDGEVYGIPKADQEGMQGTGLALRKDWLERLGLEAPTTIDEFYDVMVAFTEKDPDGNGQNDTRGLVYAMTQSQTRYCFPEIFGMSSRYYNLVDGKVVPNLLHPNYIEMIKFLQKLYKGNYMETDFATKPWINIAEDLWAGKFGAVAFGPIGTSNNWMSRYTDPNVDWVYVNLAGPDGVAHGFDLPRPDLGDCIAINASCKHPEEAMQLINWLITEEAQDLLILGIEGKHFQHLEDGSVEYLSPYKEDITLQRNEGGYGYKAILGSMKNCSTIKTLNEITRNAIDFLYANPKTDSAVLLNAPAIEVELGGLLGDIENEALASLIVFEGDLEAEVAKYVDKWLKSGGEEWIEQATEIYNSQAK